MELVELFDEQGEADQTKGVGIYRDINFIRGKYSALRRTQNIRRAVEEDEIVIRLDRRELFVEDQVVRAFRIAVIFIFPNRPG